MEASDQFHTPATLPQEKNAQNPVNWWMSVCQSLLDVMEQGK